MWQRWFSDFKAPNLPLSWRLKVSCCHYNSIYNNTWTKQVKQLSNQRQMSKTLLRVVDWFCLFIYLWVLTFPLLDWSEFGNFVITLTYKKHRYHILENVFMCIVNNISCPTKNPNCLFICFMWLYVNRLLLGYIVIYHSWMLPYSLKYVICELFI
jgi:hypothetical protein